MDLQSHSMKSLKENQTNKMYPKIWRFRVKLFEKSFDFFQKNKNKNGEWDNEIVKLTESLKELFERFDIDYKEANLYEEIQNQNSKDFFDSLVKYFKLIVQMRNSITGTETDYMISPVMNNDGEFFDSRVSDKDMPCDADANGAYNIARKGLMIIDKIKSTEDEKLNKPDLKLTNKEWLNFAQGER